MPPHARSAASEGPGLLYGADSQPRDKPVEEEVVDDGDGKAGQQARRHQRAPVVDVTPDERDGHAHAHLILFTGRMDGGPDTKLLVTHGSAKIHTGSRTGIRSGSTIRPEAPTRPTPSDLNPKSTPLKSQ